MRQRIEETAPLTRSFHETLRGRAAAANLSGVLAALQAKLGVQLEVRAVEAAG